MDSKSNKNALHPLALGQLFGSGVYLIDNEAKIAKKEENDNLSASPKSALGGFKKGVLILVNEAQMQVLPDDDFALLTKILAAVNLSMEDVLILNTHSVQNWSAIMLAENYQPQVVLLLGISPEQAQLPMRFPQFQVQSWAEITWLYAPALADMQADDQTTIQQKRQLWQALQRIFLNT